MFDDFSYGSKWSDSHARSGILRRPIADCVWSRLWRRLGPRGSRSDEYRLNRRELLFAKSERLLGRNDVDLWSGHLGGHVRG
jgi:hypothetical protein